MCRQAMMLRAAACPSAVWRGTKNLLLQHTVRPLCVKLDGTGEDVAELFERHTARERQGAALARPAQLLSLRREALHMYRRVWRYTALFDWSDERGDVWRDKLRASARTEFEAARGERDVAAIATLLLNARAATDQIVERFLTKRRELEASGALPRRLS